MSCLMASTYVVSAGSRSVEGVHELFIKQVVFVRLSAVIVIIKVYFFKRKRLAYRAMPSPSVRVFFGGKTSPCFDLSIHWLIKQITNT